MTGELAGAADILTGAAVARAVEPDAGEGCVDNGDCLNCGTTLNGAHCHACGQKGHVHRTLHAFGHDFLHSVLHFEGKIWRTLPMLFWRPGDLTRRYVHGERAKFVSPLALFLFTVFLTFATFNWLVPKDMNANTVVTANTAERAYLADRKAILADIAKLETDKKVAIASSRQGYQWMDSEIARYRNNLTALERTRGKEIRSTGIAARKFDIGKSKIDTEIARLESELAVAKKAGRPTDKINEEIESAKLGANLAGGAADVLAENDTGGGGWRFTDLEFPGSTQLNDAAKHAIENPQLLFYKIQSNTYKYSWALIPISVPFVWLLFFWRRQFKMFDHAVFVTYSLTFMMTLGALCAVLLQFPLTEVIGGLALLFAPPIHMYRQLRHAYQTSRVGAVLRTLALSVFAMLALTLYAVLVLTLGITG